MKKSLKICGIVTLALLPLSAFSATKTANCEVYSANDTYKGKCIFSSEKGGHFSIRKPKGQILDGITDINVYIIEKDVAEVRGLTTHGINSRWGEARRSSSDRACWVGSDFEICAR